MFAKLKLETEVQQCTVSTGEAAGMEVTSRTLLLSAGGVGRVWPQFPGVCLGQVPRWSPHC